MRRRAAVVVLTVGAFLSACGALGGERPQPTQEPSPAVSTVTVTPRPEKPTTDVVNINPLDADGVVRDTYNVNEPTENSSGYFPVEVSTCSEPSSYASSADTYACYVTALGADACWLEQGTSLLCIYQPWDQTLTRIPLDKRPRITSMPDDPEPLAVETSDGSRYRARNAAGNSTRKDGLLDAYDCAEGPCWNTDDEPWVLVEEGKPWIDETTDAWTVRVGSNSGKVKTKDVVRAWFISAD